MLKHSLSSGECSHWALCSAIAQLFCEAVCYLSKAYESGTAAIEPFEHAGVTTKSYQLFQKLQQRFNSLNLFQESFSSNKTPTDCRKNSNIHPSLPSEHGFGTPPGPV